jgi:hypothetical protein
LRSTPNQWDMGNIQHYHHQCLHHARRIWDRGHRLFVIDIHTSTLIVTAPPRARRAASRQLNTCFPHVAKKYAASLEANILRHRLIKKLGKAHIMGTSKEDTQRRINRVDVEGVQYMTHAKRNCRRLKSGRLYFSRNPSYGLRESRFTAPSLNTSWVEIKTREI